MKENNTWQTVYEQLQEILNKCIELWWNNQIFDKWCFVLEDGIYRNQSRLHMFSFHDLFSRDSGIMEFVEWNSIGNQAVDYHDDIDYSENEYAHIRYDRYYDYDPLYHYAKISNMTAEEKIVYFISNATLPWQKQDNIR